MYIGADYYPEHWPEERWEYDARLMREAGFTITRLAEFSWVKMEPREGEYDFDWLDRAIAVLGENGVKTILCTPTAAMPKWLYDKYPDCVAIERTGEKNPFGNRQANCFSSGSYRLMSEKITKAMAEHYKDNPNVAGWQLDNEFWGPYCFCPTCENAFREFLRKKYDTIEQLNETYGMIFWGQCYNNWGQTHMPRQKSSNPSLDLDYKRFHSDHIIAFAKAQTDILRAANPDWFVTHNMMNFAESVDNYKLGELLDVAGNDYYYNFFGSWDSRLGEIRSGAASLDFIRSVKRKNFWIIENSAGACGWEKFGRNLRPGELRRMTWHNVAHGAQAQIWFRFRTSRYGTEQYWHGLLGHDGVPLRRYREAAETAAELQRTENAIGDAVTVAQVAVMHDYEDRWAYSLQRISDEFNPVQTACMYHEAFAAHGVNVDFVSPQDSFDGYKVLVLAAKYIVTGDLAERVEEFVAAGGVLIATYRSGVKDENNIPHEMTLPGLLRDVIGVRVEEYEAVEKDFPYEIVMGDRILAGTVLADWVIPETARALAMYKHGQLAEYAALTENSFGKGRAYYVGTQCRELVNELAGKLITECGMPEFGLLPDGVEICTRETDNTEIVFILNHSDNNFTAEISGENLLTEKKLNTAVVDANDVLVIKRQKRG